MDDHDAPVIRPAQDADLRGLVDLEIAAGRAFRDVGMAAVAEHTPDIAALRAATEAGLVWVAEIGGTVAGYIAAEVIDGNAHVAQVSVAPEFAGRRIGSALIEFVEAWGRAAGHPATTLTTFRDVPWNGPYYRRLGYEPIPEAEVGPELARTMAHEGSLPGIDPALRCAMIKRAPMPERALRGDAAVTLVTLDAADWERFRAVRLASLHDAPGAFGSRYADWVDAPEERWRARLTDVDLTLVAVDGEVENGAAVGVVSGHVVDEDWATLISMWVAPEHRGAGVAERLITAVLAWAGERGRRVYLMVRRDNDRARRAYEKLGFVDVGVPDDWPADEPLEHRMEHPGL